MPELAPDAAIDSNPAWRAHVDATGDVEVATLDDLEWADAYALGSPTRFGNVSAQLKQYIDTTGGLWQQGVMADKPATAFTSAHNLHGGNESTLLALYNTFHHWGSVIVSPGFTDPSVYAAAWQPLRHRAPGRQRRPRRERPPGRPLPGHAPHADREAPEGPGGRLTRFRRHARAPPGRSPGAPACQEPVAARWDSPRSTQNSLPSGSARTAQPEPSGFR